MSEVSLFWKLCNILTLTQAATLIVGVEPNNIRITGQDSSDFDVIDLESNSNLSTSFGEKRQEMNHILVVFKSLVNAAIGQEIKVKRVWPAEPRYQAGFDIYDKYLRKGENVKIVDDYSIGEEFKEEYIINCEPDWQQSTVGKEELKSWLIKNGHTEGFLFNTGLEDTTPKDTTPDYLKKDHPCYAPKLAAAVCAWEEVSKNAIYKNNGKTARQNLENWVNNNIDEYGLYNKDGHPSKQAINEISAVANWDTDGGAPKTPTK